MGREGALALAREARRLLVKAGDRVLRLPGGVALPEAEVDRHLLHEDGLLRVPVLVLGDLLVRGYTEDLYREALGPRTPGAA